MRLRSAPDFSMASRYVPDTTALLPFAHAYTPDGKNAATRSQALMARSISAVPVSVAASLARRQLTRGRTTYAAGCWHTRQIKLLGQLIVELILASNSVPSAQYQKG